MMDSWMMCAERVEAINPFFAGISHGSALQGRFDLVRTSWRVLVVRCGRWMMPKRWSYHFDYRITKIWGQWMFLTGEPKTIVLYRILHTHHILWMLSPVLFLKISLLFPIYVFLDPKQTLTVCWTWSPPDAVQPLQLPVQDGYRVIQILNLSESLDQRKI